MGEGKWWTTPRRIIQPVLRLADHSVDTVKMVDEIAEVGANTVLLNVGCIYAWYPTGQAYHHTVPGLSRDIFGEVAERARAHGMKIMGRFDLSGLHQDAYEDHPEWFYVSGQGKPMMNRGVFATCPSGSYYEDFFYPLYDEVWERYRLDGVFFNMFGYRDRDRQGVYHGPCHCTACRRIFRERYGLRLPEREDYDDPDYYRYLDFREEMYNETGRKIYAYLKEKSPDIGIYEGRRHRSPVRLLELEAGVSAVETHWTLMIPHPTEGGQIHSAAMNGGKIWRYTPGETGRMVRSFEGEHATAVNLFQAGGGRFEAHSRGWMGMGIAQAVANDSWPYIAFIGPPWLEDKKTKPVIRELYSFLAAHEDCFRGLVSGAQVAILQSENNSRPHLGRPDPLSSVTAAYRGWYSLLVKAHVEFDVVDELQITRDPRILDKYRLLILPNLALLDDPVCAALDAHVEAGNSIIATYETSLYDCRGVARGEFGLACLGVGEVLAERKNLFNAYFRNGDADRLPCIADTGLLYMKGGYVYGRLKPGAETALRLTNPIEYAAPEFEVIEATSRFPGLIRYNHGRGRTAYLPWQIDALVFSMGLEDHILLLEELIASLVPGGLDFHLEAPAWVEATLHTQPESGRAIVQLVNESGQDGVEFREPVEIHDISFRLRLPPGRGVGSVRSVWHDWELDYSLRDGWLECGAPVLKLYDLIAIELVEN
jgi:hypothetical protein